MLMLMGTLGVNLTADMLAGKSKILGRGIIRVGEKTIRAG